MSASTTASAMAAPTAPLTIATRCGVTAPRAGGLEVWAGRSSAVVVLLVLVLLLVARDRTCAFREDQAVRALRPAKEPVSRASTCERGRRGDDATIACGGGWWEVGYGRMRAQVWFGTWRLCARRLMWIAVWHGTPHHEATFVPEKKRAGITYWMDSVR
jgi:hypothetical protein